ncbi:MAG: hypothetical protein HFJ43_02770 [Clostridia bacterium]|nr:hypothetical protein [Clostridia bacterium]
MLTAKEIVMLRKEDIGKRNERYPSTISAGGGYTLEEANVMKKTQEQMMRESSKTVEVIVNIEPLGNGKYCVVNESTYSKY